MQQICDELCISVTSFWKYRLGNPSFTAKFTRARDEATEMNVDRLMTICEEYPDVNQARLMSDNIKWTAAKKKPLVYGDRLDVNVTTVDIGGALSAARARAGLLRDVQASPPKQLANVASETPHRATGAEPVAALRAPASPGNVGSDAVQECPETALGGPITRRERVAATLAAPPMPQRATGPYIAKSATVSKVPSMLHLTDDPDAAEILS